MKDVNISEALLEALKSKYVGDIAVGRANIEVYLSNAAGIGDHPDIIAVLEAQVQKVADGSIKLEVVRNFIHERAE